MMSSAAWKNAKTANAILPAGQVTPGPKVWTGEGDPNAVVFNDWIPESKWTDGMRQIAGFAQRVAEKILSRRIVVKFCATPHHLGSASYGPSGELVFNKMRLGADWFERGITENVVRLLIHEFGHQESGDHLSAEYHEALCRIGAKLYALADAVNCDSRNNRSPTDKGAVLSTAHHRWKPNAGTPLRPLAKA